MRGNSFVIPCLFAILYSIKPTTLLFFALASDDGDDHGQEYAYYYYYYDYGYGYYDDTVLSIYF